MVFNRNRITRTFNNVPTSNNVSVPDKIISNNIIRTSGSGNYDTNSNRDDKFIAQMPDKYKVNSASAGKYPDAPSSTYNKDDKTQVHPKKGFNLFDTTTWFGKPTKYTPNSADALVDTIPGLTDDKKLADKLNTNPFQQPGEDYKYTGFGQGVNTSGNISYASAGRDANNEKLTKLNSAVAESKKNNPDKYIAAGAWANPSAPTGPRTGTSTMINQNKHDPNILLGQFQKQTNETKYNEMVGGWQSDHLKNPNRDQASSYAWLQAQEKKIDSWGGTAKNTKGYKDDLFKRYSNLYTSDNSPFNSKKNEVKELQKQRLNPIIPNTNSYSEKTARTAAAKKAAAQSANKLMVKRNPSLADDYANLGNMY